MSFASEQTVNARRTASSVSRFVTNSASEALAVRLAEDMARCWRTGDRPSVEQMLADHPELRDQTEVVVSLIYEEMCLRQEFGLAADLEQYHRRFPHLGRQLEMLLECRRVLESPPAPRLPAAGEALGDFRLLAELGRGNRGQVFLATQQSLADRPVVLKVTPRTGCEHLSLARLQHTHIAPLLFVQDDPGRDLFLLCMPYLGGASLAQLLDTVPGPPNGERSGRLLLEALDRLQAAAPVVVPARGIARQALAQASVVQVACRLGACLADALQHAHERGLLHLDVKPSNVLVTADGQPMLLDFHLARGPLRPHDAAPDWLGGTPGYMAPEHQAALAALRAGRPVPEAVDARADVYSLGVLLYEMLGGPVPLPVPVRALGRCNPRVSAGLSDIVRKCLAADPRDRYATAGAVAADLRRQLADLPLQGVRNRSLAERWRKWRRRRPHGLARIGMLAVVLAAVAAVAGVAVVHRDRQEAAAHRALHEGRQHLEKQQYEEALADLRLGLTLAAGLPRDHEVVRDLDEQVRQAERAVAARDLHRLAEQARLLAADDSLPVARAQALEGQCRAVWDRREEVLRKLASSDSEARRRLDADLLDLAILGSDLRVRLASETATRAAHEEALVVLDHAEALFGPSPVLYQERRRHAGLLGKSAADVPRRGAELPPRTPWEHHALGRSLLRTGDREAAVVELERALEHDPRDLWVYFDYGRCAYQLGRFQEAAAAFSACAGLAPQVAGCFFNRAQAYAALGRADLALRDYDQALRLDPGLAAAALNRGLLHHRAGRHAEAARDLERALANGADPATVHYSLALVHLAAGDHRAARASLDLALQADPRHRRAVQLRDRLRRSP